MKLKRYTQIDHPIKVEDIDEHALFSIRTLQEAGHTAYLVGGGVRDLLLGLKPKDFDISTSAKPEEIKKIFQKKCLLIGKRFRLAHLRFGNKIIETSTFRAGDPTSASLIVRDNRWGTEEEDVLRRDFTMNALFYNPKDGVILDYVGGVEDIDKRLLRTIGKAEHRFKQDPVRMIRLIKFQARFGFQIDDEAREALHHCRREIFKSSQARILEELLKMLESGKALPFFQGLVHHHFLELLFPCFHHFFHEKTSEIAYSYLKAIDHIAHEKPDRAVLLSGLIFPILEQELVTFVQDRQVPAPMKDILYLTETLLKGINTSSFAHFPKKLLSNVFSIIVNQFRLTPMKRPPKYTMHFPSYEDFHDALSFLKVRAIIDPDLFPFFKEWRKAFVQQFGD